MQGDVEVTLVGAAANACLLSLKLGVGLAVGSVALVADGVHSLTDLTSDVVVLGGLRLARRPADDRHAYGHGKFETLTAAVVALALLGAGGWLIWEAIAGLARGLEAVPGGWMVGVAFASLCAKESLYRITARVARATGSSALAANAWHHRSDAFSSLAVMVGGVAGLTGFPQGDAWAGIAVGLLVGWAAVRLLLKAGHELLEGALPAGSVARVAKAIEEVEGVCAWHRLRTRAVGREAFVDVHVKVDPEISVRAGHDLATEVEAAVRAALSGRATVTVHVEPAKEER